MQRAEGTAAYSVAAALALAEVVMDVDRLLHVRAALADFLNYIHHQLQHVPPVGKGVRLAPLHVLHICCSPSDTRILHV